MNDEARIQLRIIADRRSGAELGSWEAGPDGRANLRHRDLGFADLRGCNLRGALLDRASLSQPDLTGADLAGANLTSTRLEGADLRGASLAGATLHFTDLTGASLVDCELMLVTFNTAVLREVDMSGASWSRTVFAFCPDLATVRGLETVSIRADCAADVQTVAAASDTLPPAVRAAFGLKPGESG